MGQVKADDDTGRRVSTVGRVHPHVEVKIIDPATGLVVPRGTAGELCTRGYSVMLGYWDDEAQTRGAIDGFVYLRVKRRTPRGYVANIGTQVGPGARGKGVGPRMILAMAAVARGRGVAQIETQAYAWNSSSLRMGEKLGFHEPADPALARQMTEQIRYRDLSAQLAENSAP